MQGRGDVAREETTSRAARNLIALCYAELAAFLAPDVPAGETLEGSLGQAIEFQVRGLPPHGATEGWEQD